MLEQNRWPNEVRLRKELADKWTGTDLLGEALSNCFASRSRLFGTILVAVVLGIVLSAFRYIELVQLNHQVATLQSKGRNLILIQGIDVEHEPEINVRSCEALAGSAGVERAGVLVEGERISVPQLVGNLPLFETSITLFPQLGQADMLLGATVGGSSQGAPFLLATNGHTLTALTMDLQPAGLPVNSAVLVGLSPAEKYADHCLVVLNQKQDPNRSIPDLVSQLEVRKHPIAATTVLSDLASPHGAFLTRLTAGLPLAAGVVLGLLLALMAQLRSSELAAYRLSGTGRFSLQRILMLESVVVSGVYLLSGSISALYVLPWGVLQGLGLLSSHLVAASSTVLISSLLFLSVSSRTPMDLAKDR